MSYDRFRSRPFVVEVAVDAGLQGTGTVRLYEPTPGEAQLRARRYTTTPRLLYVMVTFPGTTGEVVYLFTGLEGLVKDELMSVKPLSGTSGGFVKEGLRAFLAETGLPFDVISMSNAEKNEQLSKMNRRSVYTRNFGLKLNQNSHEILLHLNGTVEIPPDLVDEMTLSFEDAEWRQEEFSKIEATLAEHGIWRNAALVAFKTTYGNNKQGYKFGQWTPD